MNAFCRAWVEAFKALTADRSETERQKLLHDSVAVFYGLEGEVRLSRRQV